MEQIDLAEEAIRQLHELSEPSCGQQDVRSEAGYHKHQPSLLGCPPMHPPIYQSLIEIPTEVRIGLAILLPVMLIWYEIRDPFADWKIRRMAREREAELRKAGLLK